MNEDKCTCEGSYEEHTCPYAEEINGDSESLCSCCDYCTQQCANDV
jgi:hypothetical protein